MTADIIAWRGIRFADLAHPFAAPHRVRLDQAPAAGGSFGAAPLQNPIPGISLGAETSFDCLFLNVWAPAGARDLPVVLYFYGGGFEMGAASLEWFDGAALAAAGPCVVVTANYRVGLFGFAEFAARGEALADAHNLGLQDAVAALHWTREHIAGFGGDSRAITVVGQSAGAFIAAALAVAPGVPPVRAIACFSGGASRIIDAAAAGELAGAALAELGLSDRPAGVIDAPAEAILDAQTRVVPASLVERNGHRPQSLGIVLDGDPTRPLVPRHPLTAVADGRLRETFVLVAATVDEADGFPTSALDAPATLVDGVHALAGAVPDSVVAAYEQDDEPDASWRRVLGDYIYRLPAARLVEAQRAAGGGAAYLEVSRSDGAPAPHGAETAGIFFSARAVRDITIGELLVELIRTGSLSGGAIDDPLVAGDPRPARVHSPADLLNIWRGVDRP